MNQVDKLKQVENLSYFDRSTLAQVIKVSKRALYENISRWIKQGELIQLKKGLYVTGKYYDRAKNKEIYAEFVANRLRFPSYLSLEYVLQKYSLLTEAIYSYTSITLKTRIKYKNELGNFVYRSMAEDLFVGFRIEEKSGFRVKEASLAKALFDYLYLKLYRVRQIDFGLIESFRLNLENLKPNDRREFQKYCFLTGIDKYKKLPELVFG